MDRGITRWNGHPARSGP